MARQEHFPMDLMLLGLDEATAFQFEKDLMHDALTREVSPENATDQRHMLLIPGTLGNQEMLADAQKWFDQIGGFKNTHVAQIPTIGPILQQTGALIKQLPPGKKTTLVGYSLGGLVAYLAALQKPDLIDTVIALDAPLVPVTARDFHPAVAAMQVNDLLTNPRIATLLDNTTHPFPPSVRIVSMYIPHDRIISQRASMRPGAELYLLPNDLGHFAMYVSPRVCRKVTSVLRGPQRIRTAA